MPCRYQRAIYRTAGYRAGTSVIDGKALPDFIDPLVERIEARMKTAVVEIEHVADQEQPEDPVMALHIGEYRLDHVAEPGENTQYDIHRIPPAGENERFEAYHAGPKACSRRQPLPCPRRSRPTCNPCKTSWEATSKQLPAPAQQFARANGFTAKPGKCLTLPAADGAIAQVLFGLEDETAKSRDLFRPGALPGLLPPGVYRFATAPHDVRLAALAFALGSYRFARYRKSEQPEVRLVPPDGVDAADIMRMAEAACLARDLINTPSNDMGPAELAQVAEALAARYGASFHCTVGDELLKRNFPLIHAVGMASSRAPRLIDLRWGDPSHPTVTLVGKGVCFDTGGLDLKPSSGMLIMKKDMGGAANVLALAQMVMDARLKVRLRVLIPAVENAVRSPMRRSRTC